MTKVTLTKPLGGHKAGATINVPDTTAERYIARGIAEKPKTTPKTTPKTNTKG